MRFQRLAAVGLLTCVLPLSSAFAGEFYVKGIGGFVTAKDGDVTASSGGATVKGAFHNDSGYAAGGAIGYYVTDNFRLEAEGVYRSISFDATETAGVVDPTDSGDIHSTAAMVNGYLDLPLDIGITPYVGAGIGVITFGGDFIDPLDEAAFDDNEIGYQGILGAKYGFGDGWALGAEYRFTGATDFDNSLSGVDLEWRLSTHAALFSFSKSFGSSGSE